MLVLGYDINLDNTSTLTYFDNKIILRKNNLLLDINRLYQYNNTNEDTQYYYQNILKTQPNSNKTFFKTLNLCKYNNNFNNLINYLDSTKYKDHVKYVTPTSIIYLYDANSDFGLGENGYIQNTFGGIQMNEYTYDINKTYKQKKQNEYFANLPITNDVDLYNDSRIPYDRSRALYLHYSHEKVKINTIDFVWASGFNGDTQLLCAPIQGFRIGIMDKNNNCIKPINAIIEQVDTAYNFYYSNSNRNIIQRTLRIHIPEDIINVNDYIVISLESINITALQNGLCGVKLKLMHIDEISKNTVNSKQSTLENNLYNYYNSYYASLIDSCVYNVKFKENNLLFKVTPCYNNSYYYRDVTSIVNIYVLYNDKKILNTNDTTILDHTTIIIDNKYHYYDYKQKHNISVQLNSLFSYDGSNYSLDTTNKSLIIDVTNVPNDNVENELLYYYHMFHINNYEFNFKFPKLKNLNPNHPIKMFGYYIDETSGDVETIYKPNSNNIITPIIDTLTLSIEDKIVTSDVKHTLLCEVCFLDETNSIIDTYNIDIDNHTTVPSVNITDVTTNTQLLNDSLIQPTKYGYLDINEKNTINRTTYNISLSSLGISVPSNCKKIQQRIHNVQNKNCYSNLFYFYMTLSYNIKLKQEEITSNLNNFNNIINDINLVKYDALFRFNK